ncbi:MAG: tandem-95 repeat protein [Proteobacteria bacterium]|nr:tandem-95 repeat protein [Pseudomonadota bacterium]MBU1739440.1 tandem-95 repeat protein [Pseudomonadota bacterium]
MSETIFCRKSTRTLTAILLVALFGLAGSAGAAQNVTVSWDHPSANDAVLAYRLYQDDRLLCETLDPAARAITCPAELAGMSVFTVAAVYNDGAEVVPPVNAQPVAHNLAVTMDEDGTANFFLVASDQENDPLTYAIVAGPASGVLVLTDPRTGAYRYSPAPDFAGTDTFTYLANDGTVDSAPASVTITVNPVNDSPAADAGADLSVAEGRNVVLDAAGSTDKDDGIVSYSWAQVSGPTAVLSDSSAVQSIVEAPDVGEDGAVLVYELTVTDQGGLEARDTVSINVTWVNEAPVADAGTDLSVAEGQKVVLNATGSTDNDDGIGSYSWAQVSGPTAALSDSGAVQPTLITPDVGTGGAVLTYELTVTDQGGLQALDTVAVNVLWVNEAPVADAGADQSVPAGATVVLDGSGSSGTDDGIASVLWVQTAGPQITLSDPAAMQPSFIAPVDPAAALSLAFELMVQDFGGLQQKDSCLVEVLPKRNNVTISWSAPASGEPVVSFRVTHNGVMLCETFDPAAREITCPVTLADGPNEFDVTPVYATATETAPAEALPAEETAVSSEPVAVLFASLSTAAGSVFDSPAVVSEPVAVASDIVLSVVGEVGVANNSPVADAGPDQIVKEGETVMLDASNSYDLDDDSLIFAWTQLAGPSVNLSEPSALQPTFAAVDIGMHSATLVFQLKVTDARGLEATDLSTVNVVWVNEPPLAAAGADLNVFEGEMVVLDASGSTDSDDGIAAYSWTQIGGPETPLSDYTAMQPVFSAPAGGDDGVSMTYEVTVTDFDGLFTRDTVIVNSSWVNEAPVAHAGVDRKVSAGEIVTLDGSLTHDADDGISLVRWSQKTGVPVTLSDPTVLMPVFKAPAQITEPMTLAFELAVTDHSGLQHTDSCLVEVSPLQ